MRSVKTKKLPSLRSLSRSTGLSVTTVEQSYNQLLVEGYVYSKAQSGYYVRDVFSHLSHTQTPSASELLAPQGTAENTSSPGEGTPVFHCDPDCFDFNKWKKCMNKILTEFSTSLFFESDPQGEPELRAEISRYLYMSRGVPAIRSRSSSVQAPSRSPIIWQLSSGSFLSSTLLWKIRDIFRFEASSATVASH